MAIQRKENHHLDTNMKGQAFGMQLTAKAFEAVTSNLYTRKPEAVARESICNADDAHKERDRMYGTVVCGYNNSVYTNPNIGAVRSRDPNRKWYATKSQGYEIHLPTDLEPYYSIQDFGVGLTVDQVLGKVQTDDVGNVIRDEDGHPVRSDGIYTTLFGSSKETSNDQIGAYGLGCKSPFSISDTFSLVIRKNGEQHTFIMYLDNDRMPGVTWITKDDNGEPDPIATTEKNGVYVEVPVQPSDYYELNHGVRKTLFTFDSDFTIVNSTETIDKMSRKFPLGQTYIQMQQGTRHSPVHYAVSGGVAYPIDTDQVSDDIREKLKLIRFNTYTIFGLGELNVPPSRETLTYDRFTKESLDYRLGQLGEGYKEYCRDAIIDDIKKFLATQSKISVYTLWKARSVIKENWADNLVGDWDKLLYSSGVFDNDRDRKLHEYIGKNNRNGRKSSRDKVEFPSIKVMVPTTRMDENLEEIIVEEEREMCLFVDQSYSYSTWDKSITKNADGYVPKFSKAHNGIVIVYSERRTRFLPAFMALAKKHSAGRLFTVKPSQHNKNSIEENMALLKERYDWVKEVVHIDDIEVDTTTVTQAAASGFSAYCGGGSASPRSWSKLVALEINEVINDDSKLIVRIPTTGFRPDTMTMSELNKLRDIAHSWNWDSDNEQKISLWAVRKKAVKVADANPDKFIEVADFLKMVIDQKSEDPMFPKYLERQAFKEIYKNYREEIYVHQVGRHMMEGELFGNVTKMFSCDLDSDDFHGDFFKRYKNINSNNYENVMLALKFVTEEGEPLVDTPRLRTIKAYWDNFAKQIRTLYPNALEYIGGYHRWQYANADVVSMTLHRIEVDNVFQAAGIQVGETVKANQPKQRARSGTRNKYKGHNYKIQRGYNHLQKDEFE